MRPAGQGVGEQVIAAATRRKRAHAMMVLILNGGRVQHAAQKLLQFAWCSCRVSIQVCYLGFWTHLRAVARNMFKEHYRAERRNEVVRSTRSRCVVVFVGNERWLVAARAF